MMTERGEAARQYCGVHFGGVVVAMDAIHQCADGRRFLVILHPKDVEQRRLKDSIMIARGTLAAGLMQMDQLSPSRLARFGEVFTSVSRIAVAGMGAS